MKAFKIIMLFTMLAVISACQKQKDDITVTLKTSGTLNVQLADSLGTKLDNVKVHLYAGFYTSTTTGTVNYNYSGEIDTKRTDNNGNVNFGTVAEGTYYVVTDTIKKDNKKYLISKVVQVISGDSKNILLNPFEYVGNIKLSLNIYAGGMTDTLDRTKIKVALVTYSDYSTDLKNRNQVISKAIYVKSFSSNGKVDFNNVPANISYYPYVFVDNNDTIGEWSNYGSIMTTKDNTNSGTVSVNLSHLIVPKTDLSLTLKYYSNTGSKAVSSANVVLIKYTDYSSNNLGYASVSKILSYAVKSGTTNTAGNVVFKNVPIMDSYYAFVYYSSSLFTWDSSYMNPYSSSTNIYSHYVSGTDLGL